jgi:hypothetical protein
MKSEFKIHFWPPKAPKLETFAEAPPSSSLPRRQESD